MATYRIRHWFERRSGIQIPASLPLGEWDAWYDKCKAEHPLQYFWGVSLPDFIDSCTYPIERRYHMVRDWIRYRVTQRRHIVDTGLKPNYYDCNTRLLHANMNLLKDFVEIDKAWMHVVFNSEERKKHNCTWLKMKLGTFRSAEAGLAHLDWEATLVYDESMGVNPTDKIYGKPTDQALKAKEIKEIYNWWVNIYPNRPDPMDASGWSAYCDSLEAEGGILKNLNRPPSKISKKAHKALEKIEADYAKEEEQMLIKLIKIRQGLWT